MSKVLKGSIDLTKLVSQRITTKKGNAALVIPIDANHIVAGEKGCYLNISVFMKDEPDQYNQIAGIKHEASSKKKWSEMSDDEKTAQKELQDSLPFIGNLKDFGGSSGSGFEQAPEVDPEVSDDLPF